jgi:butyrate kinase
MDLNTLTKHVKAGEVEDLNLMSIEGGSYVLHAQMDGKSHVVKSANGEPLHVASVNEARKCLAGVPEVPLFIVHPVVYDEMVGQSDADRLSSREPIPFRSTL